MGFCFITGWWLLGSAVLLSGMNVVFAFAIAYRAWLLISATGISFFDLLSASNYPFLEIKRMSGFFDISPDGQFIVRTINITSDTLYNRNCLEIISVKNNQSTIIKLVSEETESIEFPRWSPSGDKIFYLITTPGDNNALCYVKVKWPIDK